MHDWEHVTSKAFAAIFPLSGTSVPAADSNDGQTTREPNAQDADALNESHGP
jgi:hypothetical protein